MKEFKIVPIRNGTVLDHLEAGSGLAILQSLGFPVAGSNKVISLAINLPSESAGMKDVVKFENIEFTAEELAEIKSASKTGTLVVIRNYDVAEKVHW